MVLWSSSEKLRKRDKENGDADRIERADGEASGREGDERLEEKSEKAEKKRLFHVDFARICAVMCVIFEHSGRDAQLVERSLSIMGTMFN